MSETDDPQLFTLQPGLADTAKHEAVTWSETKNAQLVPEGQRPCPICGKLMESRTQYDVLMDVCPAHGVWLDGQELQGILFRLQTSTTRSMTEQALRWENEDLKRQRRRHGLF